MNTPDRRFARRQLVTRLVVAVAAAFVMLALHDAVATASHEDAAGVVSATQSGSLPANGDEALAAVDVAPSPTGDGLSGECGLAIMCVVALASLGAALLLRGRNRGMVLWSLPRAHLVVSRLARASRTSLTPLQLSCVLRC